MFNVRLAGGHLYGKQLFTWLSLVVFLMASFVLSFFPLDVLDEIWFLRDFFPTLTLTQYEVIFLSLSKSLTFNFEFTNLVCANLVYFRFLGEQGMTFQDSLFTCDMFAASLDELAKSISVHLLNIVFIRLLLFISSSYSSTVLCRIVLAFIDILIVIASLIELNLLFTDCGALSAPADVLVNYSNGTTYLSVATFECRIGYTLEGDAMRTCQTNESWSNKNPTCQINGENSRSM